MSDEVDSISTVEATAPSAPEAPALDTPPQDAPDTGTGNEQPTAGSTNPIPATTEAPNPQDAQPPAAQPAQPKPVDWQQRYSHLQSETDRRVNAMRREQQTSSTELASLRQFRQQQEAQAREQNLKPWMPKHPEYQKFNGMRERAKTIGQQLANIPQNLPPEQQQALKEAIMSPLSQDEQQQLKNYREEVNNFQQRFFEDPIGSLDEKLGPLIEQRIQQSQARQQADYRVEQDFQNPDLKPLVETHAAQLQEALGRGVPYDDAMHTLRLFSELEQARKELDALKTNSGMASEQIRLAKGRATITRDPAPSSTADPYALAKKEATRLGIRPDDPRFMKILAKFDKSDQSIFSKHQSLKE